MKALVTGGGGFLGGALVRALLTRGHEVRVLSRHDSPSLRELGADTVQADLRDPDAITLACQGMEVVFHTASKAEAWGDPEEYEAINIQGTRNVVDACRAGGARALVFTSTPSVVHDAKDIEGEDESLPYATRFFADFPRTKAIAEKDVRAASDSQLLTVALRPQLMWGPGDRHLLPRLLERARAGRLRKVGSRDVKVDTTYIDNCVEAHLLAAAKLVLGTQLGGRVYFVSDGSPVGLWTMANRLLAAAGAPPVTRAVPAWVATALGATLEGIHRAFSIEREPGLTRFAASQLSHAQWFDISAARRDLGYAPRVSIEEGLARLTAWCQETAIGSEP
jgi:nucleoside-diphosphate-sugar epimerase